MLKIWTDLWLEKHVLLQKGPGHIFICILDIKTAVMISIWHNQVFLIHGQTCAETVKLRQARLRELCPELWCLAWFWIQNRCRNCAGKNRLEGFHLGQPVARGLPHACTYVPGKKKWHYHPVCTQTPPIGTLYVQCLTEGQMHSSSDCEHMLVAGWISRSQ